MQYMKFIIMIEERYNKKLLIVKTTTIGHLVEQFTHDPRLESLNTVSAGTMRNRKIDIMKLLLYTIAMIAQLEEIDS
jgi:hypothetical protein